MCCGFGVVCAGWGVVVAGRRDYLTAIVTFGLAVFLFSMLLEVAIAQLGWISVRGKFDSQGTVICMDQVLTRLFIIALVVFIPSGAIFTIFGLLGDLDIPMTRRQIVVLPVAMAIPVIAALIALINASAKGGVGCMRLTPHGFEVANIFTTNCASWTDIVEITDKAPDTRVRLPIVVITKEGPPQVIRGANGYTPRGRALYWMIRHYWLHPENRVELTDGRALNRLRNEQFEVE